MRSTLLNLKDPAEHIVLQGLVPQAAVFIEGDRGRKMGELGFGPEHVAVHKPGIICLLVCAYGWEGPWRDFAGFDMEALTSAALRSQTAADSAPVSRPGSY